jgi:O-antigen ligase
MSGGAAAETAVPLSEWWRRLRNPAFWMPLADMFAVLTALALPWSTSLVGIFTACWIGSAALVVDYPAWFRSLKRPACALPLALFALAAAGTLWSQASWDARIHAVGPALKLLFLPGLFHYFQRSSRGIWVFIAFLASCTLLMAVSWLVAFQPGLALPGVAPERGMFVKNYIDQSQEFALCAVALAYPIVMLWRERKTWLAALLLAIAIGLLANMAFVIVSRTALVTMPLMLAAVAALHLKRRTSAVMFSAFAVLAAVSFAASPPLRKTIDRFASDYREYRDSNAPTSIGLRLEFWRKSLQFVGEAPIVGHGTGSTRMLFERAVAKGDPQTSASANVIANPHNQTLGVAVQWGVLGVVVLWAMWISHFLLFRGEGMVAAIGLLVVVQNILTSLFNSHIFDFHEGWMYVLGVGVAGGMAMRRQASGAGERE